MQFYNSKHRQLRGADSLTVNSIIALQPKKINEVINLNGCFSSHIIIINKHDDQLWMW